jgi:NADH-quinone oxidoreductase subunit M
MDSREKFIAATLLAFAILLGVLPNTMFSIMNQSTSALTESMARAYPSLQKQAADGAKLSVTDSPPEQAAAQ